MIIAELAALVAVAVTGLLAPLAIRPLLHRFGVIDVPNERSSHGSAAIRGVGLAPLAAITVGYLVLLLPGDRNDVSFLLIIVGISAAAALLGLIEDVRGVPVVVRACLQILIGLAGAGAIIVLTASPWWLASVYALSIGAYINVANFMDGVDGISGMHGAVVGVTYALIGVIGDTPWLISAGAILALAFASFLPWNILRGGMFLGDVGSYLLGGGIAVIAVAAIATGVPVLAVLGPLAIYLADTGATLVRRMARGERWFEAHRSHVYQRLTDLGFSHVRVASIVTLASVGTAGLGVLVVLSAQTWPIAVALMIAVLVGYLSLGVRIRKFRRPHAATKGEAAL